MKPLICRFLMWSVMFAAATTVSSLAQTAAATPPPPIEVVGIKFGTARTSAGNWYETEIEVQGRPGSATDNGNFINRVKVVLNLGIFSVKSPQGAKVPDTFYRASAEAVGIETGGGKTTFRFFLPPEIVKRDKITGDQKFYLVELFVGGKALPMTKYHWPAATFIKPEFVESFRGKVSSEAGANDGILLPQYLTPFAFDSSGPIPSFVRVESTR